MSTPAAAPDGVRVTTPAAIACVKGRDAPRVMEAAGLPLPLRPNSWRLLAEPEVSPGGWCLRLGAGEYLLAHDHDPRAFDGLAARAAGAPDTACHVLLRADRCIHLEGPLATARLLQVCDIDERGLLRQPDAVALVMLADVSVALHACPDGGWRIWCDPTWVMHVSETFAALDARAPPVPPPVYFPRQHP
jgi:hypothetical protein